tara:strand:+ start:269 stop:478 length:210 start_codon:yes stop_codon:yes gene_type:complete
MKEIQDKIDEIEAKGDKFHAEGDTPNMTYCMGQISVLRWMLYNCRETLTTGWVHFVDIHSIHAGFKEEE